MPRSLSKPSFRLQISPWILSYCPSFHACCTIGILATLYTCSITLSSHSLSSFYSSFLLESRLRCWALIFLMWDSHAQSGPWSCFLKAALIPPHPQCPLIMISLTPSTCTEYCTTASTLISEGGAWFAIFLCTNSSPGCRPTISFAGTLESEHPIHKYQGYWMLTNLSKY